MVDTGYNSGQPYTTQFAPDGLVYWSLSAGKSNFNDVTVQIPKRNLNNLLDIYPLGDVILRHVYASWIPTTSGAGIQGTLNALSDSFGGIYTLKRVLSLATATDLEWTGELVVSQWRDASTIDGIILFMVPAATVTTLDDIIFEVEGVLYPRPESPNRDVVHAVSLEGYKWPLVRR